MNQLNPAALAIPVGDDWATASFAASRLLRGGWRVHWVMESAAADLAPGSYLIPLDPSFDPGLGRPVSATQAADIIAACGAQSIPVAGASIVAAPLSPVRVGLYGGGGAPYNQAAILAACGIPVRFLSDAEVRAGYLREVDVFLMPGGGTRAMNGQIEPLGEEGCRAIADFVRDGGMYIGCCAGTYDCIVNDASFLASCPAQAHLQLLNAGPWQGDAAIEMFGGIQSPGVGVIQARNANPGHPVMFGMPETFPLVHYNGPVLDPLPESQIAGASGATGPVAFAGVRDDFTAAEDFHGATTAREETYVGKSIAAERFAAAFGEFGTGRVVAFGSHPELGPDLPMLNWMGAGRMILNAVLWQAVSRPGATSGLPVRRDTGQVGLPLGSSYRTAAELAGELADRARTLAAHPIDPTPTWLAPEYAMSTFGRSGPEIWQQSLVDIQAMADQISGFCQRLEAQISALLSPASGSAPVVVRQAVLAAEHRLHDRRAESWNQDGGYQGVLALLQAATSMCEQADAAWEIELGPPAGAYGYVDTNPYHLVAGSYLAAVGVVAGAVQLLRVTESELAMAEQLAGDSASPRPLSEVAAAGLTI